MSDSSDAKPTSGRSRRDFLKAAPLLAGAPMVLNSKASARPAHPLVRRDSGERSPVIEKILSVVPRPILPSRPDLVEMYDRCWELGFLNTEVGQPKNGFVHWYVDEAFDPRIFQWDVSFSMAWAKYGQGALPGIESQDNFYRKQHHDGAIGGVIRANGEDNQPRESPSFTHNNLFSWAEWEHYLVTGDASRFERLIPKLVAYAEWARKHRRHDDGHYYWSGFGSGMDNSPRSKPRQFYPPHGWVDYNGNEALAAYYLAKMADVVGDEETAEQQRALHAEIKRVTNKDMWSEVDRIYWDVDRDLSPMKVKTIASFWPMWGRIAEPHQVDGLIAHLEDPESFNRPHRVPTTAADEPTYQPDGGYWRGSIWAPTNHMVVRGLVENGRQKEAREIVVNHLDNMAEVFQETNTVWENYAPEKAAPGDPAKPDFVGWSADGPIAQLIENYIGIELDVPNDTIHWTLLTAEEVGLDNLKFGDGTVRLKAAERNSTDDPVTLHVATPRPFTIQLNDGRATKAVAVEAGQHEYAV